MTTNTRELSNSPIRQSVREQRSHVVQLAEGLNAGSPSVKVFDEVTGADISADAGVLTGMAFVAAGLFTTPLIQVPNAGRAYRVECWFAHQGELWIRYFRIIADV